jgi:cystathionine beta-lyase
VYPGHTHVPYASISEVAAGHTITAIAASKAWNLAGLKCAQIVLSNEDDVAIWEKDAGWTAHGASTLGVIASIAAFNTGQEWLDGVVDYLDGNRRLLGDLLGELLPGVTYTMPEGTYLTWLDFSALNLGCDLAVFFRDKARVAVTDGNACGEVGSECVRFNIAMPRPLLEQAVRQMATAVQAV